MPRKGADTGRIYQLKVTLQGSKPPIWRRIQVPASISLPQLHTTIQTAMGWLGGHMHQFTIAGVSYGTPDPEFGQEMRDEARVKLERVITAEKERFIYEYDFGDSWNHVVLLEKILHPAPGVQYPLCLTGKRACPPEDVGGVWGYANFLEAIGNADHPEHEELLEWHGGEFDPEAFSRDEVNRRLAHPLPRFDLGLW